MKKIIATIAASVLSVAAMAQKPGDGVLRIHTTDGEVTPIFTKNIKSMTFEEVTPLTMNIDVEETGTDYILVDFPMPEGCSHWLMYVSDEELVGDDRDVRMQMKERYMEDWRESKYLQIPGLKSNTTYYLYALLYDQDGVPAGISRATATTKAKTNDEFTVNVTDIKSNTANVTFTPKDQTQQYYCFIVSDDTRNLMIEKYGSIEAADQAYWDYSAEQYGFDLDFYLNQILFRGTKTVDAKEFYGQALQNETLYWAYCYAVNSSTGEITTPVYEQSFTTLGVEGSSNELTITVTQTYHDGCDVTVKTTNNDKYMLDVQSKETWENKLSAHGGDAKKAAADLLRIAYAGQVDEFTKQGDFTGKLSYGKPDTDCVVIACGYDSGITTDVQAIPFHTSAE